MGKSERRKARYVPKKVVQVCMYVSRTAHEEGGGGG